MAYLAFQDLGGAAAARRAAGVVAPDALAKPARVVQDATMVDPVGAACVPIPRPVPSA